MKEDRIAIVAGIRSPFCKGGGVMKDMEADDLGAYVVTELLAKTGVAPKHVDELVFGNVIQPSKNANIARIISVKAGIPVSVPAVTVNRNCASGLEAITNGADKILLGHDEIVVAGGTESMSNFPVEVRKEFKEFLQKLAKAKTFGQKIDALTSFSPASIVPETPEIADPLCGLSMGQTAENLAREFKVSRKEQDEFALLSQNRAEKAISEGRLNDEITPIPIGPKNGTVQIKDEGPRANQTLEDLSKLKPAFDKTTGTVTAGNSSPITDGAAAVLLMKESKAKELGLKPLGYIRAHAAVGLEPSRMGLGPVFAMAKVLKKTGLNLTNIDLFEINEAFAAQVLAVLRASASDEFGKNELGLDKALGTIDLEKLNVNGGAIALGHPLGASGTRLVITLLKELKRRNKKIGMASLCIGGGQGQAVIVEVE